VQRASAKTTKGKHPECDIKEAEQCFATALARARKRQQVIRTSSGYEPISAIEPKR